MKSDSIKEDSLAPHKTKIIYIALENARYYYYIKDTPYRLKF